MTPPATTPHPSGPARAALALATGERDSLAPLINLARERPDLARDLINRMAHQDMRGHIIDLLGSILTSAHHGQRLDAIADRLRRLADSADEAHATVRRMDARAFAAREAVKA